MNDLPPGLGPAQDEPPPHLARGLLIRGALGALAIALCAVLATATAGILQIKDIADDLEVIGGLETASASGEDEGPPPITKAEAGDARTFLLLGSDRRYNDLKKNNSALEEDVPARSDTMMLVRLDPDEPVTSVLSVPRDLRVEIPGHGFAKLNDSYALGGPALTSQTLQELLGIDINHVVNATFGGFRKAVTTVGCVYADIDRRYFHSNEGLPQSQHYAEIDIDPGYQELCGQKALDYVRFRHADSDLVRAARQQDFLRAMKDQVSSSRLFDDRDKLLDIFLDSVQVDGELKRVTTLESVLKLAVFSAGKPVRQVPFPATFVQDGEISYVEASQASIDRAVDRFLDPPDGEKPKTDAEGPSDPDDPAEADDPEDAKDREKKPKKAEVDLSLLRNIREESEDRVAKIVADGELDFPLYFPSRATNPGRYSETEPNPHVYTLRDRADKKHKAYRMVFVHNALEGQYYGVQGTTWRTPPILENPTSKRKVHGKTLFLYRDGSRLRFVAWRTDDAVYWVSNTLTKNLSNDQMLGIASTLKRFK